jgi:uncharacterized protein YjbJ (UPF0337 family)
MNRSHEFGLTNVHQPLDRHFSPKRSHVTKHMHSIWREKRSSYLSDQSSGLGYDFENDADAPLREQSISENQVKAIWQQEISKARRSKGKVTEDDLLKTHGQIERLAGLVQERYAVSRVEAEKQVAAFLRRRHS